MSNNNNKNNNDDPHFDPVFHHKIMHLENEDFDNNGRLVLPDKYSGKLCVIMVFAVWCGHCKTTKVEHAKLPDLLGDNVVVAAINGSGDGTNNSEKALMKRLKNIIPDFRGFPHIVVFGKDGKLLGSHEGKRTAEDIAKTVKKYS